MNEGTTNQSRGRIRYGSRRTVKSSSEINQYQPFTISGPVSKRSTASKLGAFKVSKSSVSLTPSEEIDEFVRAAQQRMVYKKVHRKWEKLIRNRNGGLPN